MQAVGRGLWRWTTPHPRWRPEMAGPGGWEREVASVAFAGPEGLVVVDPLVEDWSALDALVGGGPITIVLTAPWHQRSAAEVAARYGATVSDGEGVAGVEVLAVAGADEAEVVLWLPTERALITAEVLTGTAEGLRVAESPSLRSRDEQRAWLDELAALPVELVLPSHGPPVLRDGRREIEAALSRPPW